MNSFIEFLHLAVNSKYGIVLRVTNVAQARTKFSLAKKEANLPIFDCLEARQSPFDPLELWIVKKGAEVPDNVLDILGLIDE